MPGNTHIRSLFAAVAAFGYPARGLPVRQLIYALAADTGELRLIEPSSAGYKELARAKVLEAPGKEAWAPMALGNGRLLVRDHAQLKCLDVRER